LALREAMEVEVAKSGRTSLTVAADGEAAHRYVVSALDAAEVLGFEQVTIATQAPEP
jgi:biopolymer transport protein ExbD